MGILLVVFGHVCQGCINVGLTVEPAAYAAVDQAVYLFHMPPFFFRAGLFLENARPGRSLTRYARDRA